VSNFTGTGIKGPVGIAVGPDGALWFTNETNNSIGRITTTGTVTNYTGTGISRPWGITAGPDGALWFTNRDSNSIGRITTTGTVSNYTGTGISAPFGITVGPDGALWFTNGGNASIGRITTTGTVGNFTGTGINDPIAITAGPDGALWFANEGNDSIGRITTTGTVINYGGSGIRGPNGITAGPDGALWFDNFGADSIGRITTSGSVTTYRDGTWEVPWWGITAGPDGAIWFSNSQTNTVAKIPLGKPTITPGAAAVVEGNSGTVDLHVPVRLSNPNGQTVTVQWNTVFLNAGSAIEAGPASDYSPAGGTVSFAPGETRSSVTITVNGDTVVEPDEWIVVSFHDATNANIGGFAGLGFGGITDDDRSTVVPGGATVIEGNSGTSQLQVPVTLSARSTVPVTVQWNTVFLNAGSAIEADPASDYTPAGGTVSFAPGETTSSVTITVNGDTLVEPDEWIVVSFHDATNAKIGGFYGLDFGVIANDDTGGA
jgi:virginiamycin B lyase